MKRPLQGCALGGLFVVCDSGPAIHGVPSSPPGRSFCPGVIMSCDSCLNSEMCRALSMLERELFFGTHLKRPEVRAVMVEAMAANCELYVERQGWRAANG